MTDAKHTKGPWTLTRPDRHGYAHVNAPGWLGLAEVCVEITDERSAAKLPRLSEQAEANANLICAAPDLLAACRAAFTILVQRGDPFAGPDWELGHRLSAAIGKAEGDKEANGS